MAEQIILDFNINTESLTRLAEKMEAIGALSKDQVDKFKAAGEAMAKAQQAARKSADETARSLEKQSKILKDIPKAIAGSELNDAAGKFAAVNNEISKMANESSSLKAQLRALKEEMQRIGDEGSPQFQKLAFQAAKLEDKIKDVNERVRVMASDTFRFDAAVGAVRGIAAAFAAAQGAVALFGDKNENLQKAILKVQAATATLTAVQEIANLVTGQGALKIFALNTAHKAYQAVLAASTRAVQFFGTASAAAWAAATLGLSVLIAGIAALASNWESLTQKVKEFIGLNKELNESNKQTIDLENKLLNDLQKKLERQKDLGKKQLEFELEILKLKGAKQEDILKKEIELARFELEKNKERIETNEKVISQYEEKEKKTGAIILTSNKLREINNDLAMSNELLTAKIEGLNKQLAELSEKAAKARAEMIEIKKMLKEADEQLSDVDKFVIKNIDSVIKGLIKEAHEKLQIIRNVPKVETEMTLELRLRLDPKFRKQWIEEQMKEIEQIVIGLGRELSDALFSISSERRDRELQDALSKIEAERQAEISNKDLTEAQKAAINERYRRKEARLKLEAWKADKAAAITQAMINGLLAITTAIAKLGPPPHPAGIAGIAAAGTLTAMSVASIAAKRPPQFRKGTKDAPEGFAIVGEEGPELVYLKKGQKVITAPETKAILERYEIPTIIGYDDVALKIGNAAQYLDASEIGKAIAQELAKNPSLHVRIDSEGFNTYLVSAYQKREILNKKFVL